MIGAGCHSASLSGSTVFCCDVQLPVKNLPVAVFSREEQDSDRLPELIRQKQAQAEGSPLVLALPGYGEPDYARVSALAERIIKGCQDKPVFICLESDMAKALGQCIRLRRQQPCLCLDGVALSPDCYLDVGAPVGPAYPVVVKTLVLSKQ